MFYSTKQRNKMIQLKQFLGIWDCRANHEVYELLHVKYNMIEGIPVR